MMIVRYCNNSTFAFVVAGITAMAAPLGAAHAMNAEPISTAIIDEAFIADIRERLTTKIVVYSVMNRNAKEHADIDALDAQWRRELGSAERPLVSATLANPLSNYLTRLQAHSLGLYSEIIVVDARGLNVGQSTETSDYWQGDEAKFLKTFPRGAQAAFIDEPEWHEESRTWRAQVNVSIPAPSGDSAIGVGTFEINLTELQRRTAD